MTKWMKFKLKMGFLVLARVKGKTSQQSLMTWLAFCTAATLCLPLMRGGGGLADPKKGGRQGPKKYLLQKKIKVLECPEMARFAIKKIGSRRVFSIGRGNYLLLIPPKRCWRRVFSFKKTKKS
jgi:hypothetical protein